MNKKQRQEFFRKLGAKGGKATVKKYGKGYMKRLAVSRYLVESVTKK